MGHTPHSTAASLSSKLNMSILMKIQSGGDGGAEGRWLVYNKSNCARERERKRERREKRWEDTILFLSKQSFLREKGTTITQNTWQPWLF